MTDLAIRVLLRHFDCPTPGSISAVEYSTRIIDRRKYQSIVEHDVKDLMLLSQARFFLLIVSQLMDISLYGVFYLINWHQIDIIFNRMRLELAPVLCQCLEVAIVEHGGVFLIRAPITA